MQWHAKYQREVCTKGKSWGLCCSISRTVLSVWMLLVNISINVCPLLTSFHTTEAVTFSCNISHWKGCFVSITSVWFYNDSRDLAIFVNFISHSERSIFRQSLHVYLNVEFNKLIPRRSLFRSLVFCGPNFSFEFAWKMQIGLKFLNIIYLYTILLNQNTLFLSQVSKAFWTGECN